MTGQLVGSWAKADSPMHVAFGMRSPMAMGPRMGGISKPMNDRSPMGDYIAPPWLSSR